MTPRGMCSGLTPRSLSPPRGDGGAGGLGSPRGDGPPRVWYAWKAALRLPAAKRPLYPAHVSVTLAPTPRRDAATALLATSAHLTLPAPSRALTLGGTVHGSTPSGGNNLGVSSDGGPGSPGRPSRRERIERERTLGGGWRTAEAQLARAPPGDMVEVAQSLGRVPYETLVYGMDPAAAHAHTAAALGLSAAYNTDAAGGTPVKGGRLSDHDVPMSPALAIALGRGGGGGGKGGGGYDTRKPAVVKLPYARELHDECELPNAAARVQPALPPAATTVVLSSFDPAGRRLAVVCKEGSMHTLRVFDVATGAALAWFPGHGASVYDIAWAPTIAPIATPSVGGGFGLAEEFGSSAAALGTADFTHGGGAATHVMTASADGAARAWAVGGSAAAGGGDDMVAQHACECYAAAWHPVTPGITATVGLYRLLDSPQHSKKRSKSSVFFCFRFWKSSVSWRRPKPLRCKPAGFSS
jgi:hypothetical protein